MISPVHMAALSAELPYDLLVTLALYPELSLRAEQCVPPGDWRSCGYLTGRGWGKTYGIASEINKRVALGECSAIALIAPKLQRVQEVQVPPLIATSRPECPCEEYRGGVRWANGVIAEATTAEIKRPSSGSNFDLSWLTEIVAWDPSTRRAAFDDITTATRSGKRPQYLWDTTSSGKNDVIAKLLEQHADDPIAHRVTRGTMFGNPLLTRRYLVDEARKYARGTRRYDEEILGLVFSEAAGALWKQEWIDRNRVHSWPSAVDNVVLGLDPALSGESTADEVGIAKAAIAGDQIYLTEYSDRMSPEEYAQRIVRECMRDASGVVVERNHVGQHARDLIRVHARLAGLRVEVLPDSTRAFPPRNPGTIYVREIVSHTSKENRGAPVAALYAAGRVHHVGELANLEHEQTTWEPGTRRSPNRLDAAVFAIAELGDVARERRDVAKDVAIASRVSKMIHTGPRRGLGIR